MQAFRQAALEVAERLLGQLDRRPDSPTSGCFDRTYWCYRSVDFASSWFNNATEYLALLAHLDEEPWRSAVLAEWAASAVDFSLSLVHPDGSVSEVYPNEHGFCATAFLCSHLAAATALLGSAPDRRLGMMAEFLRTDRRAVPANQRAVAALALLRAERLLGDARFGEAGRLQLKSLAAEQDEAGGFKEYNGADIGYQTVTLSALAQIERDRLAQIDKDMLRGALNYLDRAVGAQAIFDYRRTSRRTQFLYPFGLAYYRSPVLQRLIEGLNAGTALRPAWLDDRYVADLATDHLRTYLHTRDGSA